MGHPIHKIASFEIPGSHMLTAASDDCTEQSINFKPVLKGELFGSLSDPQVFRQAAIDSQAHMLVWPNRAAFDPATLHDWLEKKKAMKEMAQGWERDSPASTPLK